MVYDSMAQKRLERHWSGGWLLDISVEGASLGSSVVTSLHKTAEGQGCMSLSPSMGLSCATLVDQWPSDPSLLLHGLIPRGTCGWVPNLKCTYWGIPAPPHSAGRKKCDWVLPSCGLLTGAGPHYQSSHLSDSWISLLNNGQSAYCLGKQENYGFRMYTLMVSSVIYLNKATQHN